MPNLPAALIVFALGCLLIHAGRGHARLTTTILTIAVLVLALTLGGLVCARLGLPSGSAEAGELFWPPGQ